MNIIQKAGARLLGLKADSNGNFLTPENNQLFRQLFKHLGASIPINPQTDPTQFITQGYEYNHFIYQIISFLSRKAASVDYVAYRYTKGGKKEYLDEHDILGPIYQPNAYQGKNELLEQYHGFKYITGNSYLYTPRLPSGIDKGRFTEMHVMPSNLIEIVSGARFEPVGGYKMRWGQQITPFEPEEVMHSKYANYNFEDSYQLYGMSPIQAGWAILQKSNSNVSAAKSMFDNKGAQGVIYDKSEITSNGTVDKLSSDQYQRMQAKWDRKTRGTANKGRILITAGDFGYIDLGMSSVDLGLLEDSQATKHDICGLYHVPPVLFDTSESSFNNMTSARKMVWSDALKPECGHFADEYNRHVGAAYSEGGKVCIEPDYSNIEELQSDKKEQSEWLDRAWWIKGSEKRERMGFDPDPELDKYYIPMGIIPSDELTVDEQSFIDAENEKVDYFRK
jgi:HK97 family phage portal protein